MKKIEYEFGSKINSDPSCRLTYLFDAEKRSEKRRAYFLCECGNVIDSTTYYVRLGKTLSCGCLARERAKARKTVHGLSGDPLYHVYRAMVSRCTNPKDKAFKYYGGRGISVCSRWMGDNGFSVFLEDMGERPEGLTLDRVDTNGDYSPDNCRWVSMSDQIFNRNMLTSNKSGVTGVCWQKDVNMWAARISKGGKNVSLGLFENIEDAIKARRDAEIDLYGYNNNY